MKKKRHSPEQIIRKLREAEGHLAVGVTIGQACQKLEISEQTFHRWRNVSARRRTGGRFAGRGRAG